MQEYSIEYSLFVHPAKTQTATFYFTLEATSDIAVHSAAQSLFIGWRVISITALGQDNLRRVVWSIYE